MPSTEGKGDRMVRIQFKNDFSCGIWMNTADEWMQEEKALARIEELKKHNPNTEYRVV